MVAVTELLSVKVGGRKGADVPDSQEPRRGAFGSWLDSLFGHDGFKPKGKRSGGTLTGVPNPTGLEIKLADELSQHAAHEREATSLIESATAPGTLQTVMDDKQHQSNIAQPAAMLNQDELLVGSAEQLGMAIERVQGTPHPTMTENQIVGQSTTAAVTALLPLMAHMQPDKELVDEHVNTSPHPTVTDEQIVGVSTTSATTSQQGMVADKLPDSDQQEKTSQDFTSETSAELLVNNEQLHSAPQSDATGQQVADDDAAPAVHDQLPVMGAVVEQVGVMGAIVEQLAVVGEDQGDEQPHSAGSQFSVDDDNTVFNDGLSAQGSDASLPSEGESENGDAHWVFGELQDSAGALFEFDEEEETEFNDGLSAKGSDASLISDGGSDNDAHSNVDEQEVEPPAATPETSVPQLFMGNELSHGIGMFGLYCTEKSAKASSSAVARPVFGLEDLELFIAVKQAQESQEKMIRVKDFEYEVLKMRQQAVHQVVGGPVAPVTLFGRIGKMLRFLA